ncbi:hypothetical protein AB0M44_36790 [Streptosporangium subroseum]|uniref:hypothetical protein n=1 Tax=Streptosporangium subroseum TaxID=106412 RepID=UPI0034463A46
MSNGWRAYLGQRLTAVFTEAVSPTSQAAAPVLTVPNPATFTLCGRRVHASAVVSNVSTAAHAHVMRWRCVQAYGPVRPKTGCLTWWAQGTWCP